MDTEARILESPEVNFDMFHNILTVQRVKY